MIAVLFASAGALIAWRAVWLLHRDAQLARWERRRLREKLRPRGRW
jgi:hypothetical protein